MVITFLMLMKNQDRKTKAKRVSLSHNWHSSTGAISTKSRKKIKVLKMLTNLIFQDKRISSFLTTENAQNTSSQTNQYSKKYKSKSNKV